MKQVWQRLSSRFLHYFSTNHYLKRLIWLGCLSAVVPVLLIGSAYYYFSMNKLSTQFQENNLASLHQLKDRVEHILTNLEHESLQLAGGPLIRAALDNLNYETDYFQQLDILEMFQLHKNTNNLIEDIMFYNDQHGLLLTNTYGLVRLEEFYGRQDIDAAMAEGSRAGWMYLPESGERGYISYVRDLPVMSINEPRGVLIIQVKEEALRGLLKSYSVSLENQSLTVLDSRHRVLLQTEGLSAAGIPVEEDQILRAVTEDEGTSNHYILEGENGKELVAFYETSMGRTYVSRLPEREMMEQLHWIKVLMAFLVSIFVLIGVLLTWFSSRMAYNPIQQLLRYGETLRKNGGKIGEGGFQGNEIEYIRSSLAYLNEQAESLNSYIGSVQPDLRDRFLQRLLGSGSSWRRDDLEAGCAKYRIPVLGQYMVMVVKVENLIKKKRFLPSEWPVILFAIKNVITELLAQSHDIKGYVLDREEREVIAIVRLEEGTERELRTRAGAFAESVHEALSRFLSFSTSVGIGRATGVQHLAQSLKEAQLALQYRLFQDAAKVLFYEDMIRIERNPVFMYPKEIEGEMIEYLWNGALPQAEASLYEFSRRIRVSESYNIIFQCYHILLSAIVQSMEERGPGIQELLGGNLFDQLKENQTSEEMHDWFIGVLFSLYQEISHDLRTRSSRLIVQRVCSHITSEPEGTHSLAECAELVHVSPSYLSRLFKKETGMSFIEYIMNNKIQKAKQLLKDTDHTVMEIAELVGYSERNLNRAFQRHMQMSPRQYRLSVR